MGRSGAHQQIQWHVSMAAMLAVIACAGRSTREPAGNGGDGTGGSTSTSTGGTTTGAGGVGGTTSSGGTGNAGAGSGGDSTMCTYAGVLYLVGDSYPAGDGCNSCTCTASGSACTTKSCAPDDCNAISQQYSADVTQALKCQTDKDCRFVTRAIACGCQFYASDTSALDALAEEWSAEQCAEKYPLKCPACSPLGSPYCNQSGLCASSDSAQGGVGGTGGVAGTGGLAGTGGVAGEAGAAGVQ